MPVLQSQTWKELRTLFRELSPERRKSLLIVLAASLFQGVIDILLVGLLARLVGLLAGAKLEDQIPGIRFFGGGFLDQAGWIVLLLIASFWFASAVRFGVALLEALLAADIWSDLVNKVYGNLLMQNYEFFTQKRSAVLSERFNRILTRVTSTVISPMIAISGNVLSVSALLIGVAIALGGKALTIFAFLLIAYLIASLIITPYLRLFLRQKMRYTRRIRLTFSESLRSMRDIQLYSSHQFFVDRFMRDGTIAKRNDRLANLLPNVPKFLIEPAGITILFLVGLAPALVSGDSDQLRAAMPELATVLVVLLRISGPLQSMFRSLNKLRGGLPEVKDALDLLCMRPTRLSLADPSVPSPEGVMPRRLIELRDVTFSYGLSGEPVLRNVDLSIPVGSRIALVGKTGSGKTTLAHLLLGLYKPESGELLLDGLTFDLVGLPPGPALPTPGIDYHFNCEAAGLDRTEAFGLFPGPHIASGLHSLPVLRTLLRLGAALARGCLSARRLAARVMAISAEKCPNTNVAGGQAFLDWLISDDGQGRISAFKPMGKQLFFPNADSE